jgi:RES domain-containing protein
MRVWRIASARHPLLDGEGARLYGGRWNSPGRPAVYTSAHASLAVLEKLAWTDPDDVPVDLELTGIDVPVDVPVEHLDLRRLPANWPEPGCPACVQAGDEWLQSLRTAALVVPSAVMPVDSNVLINPLHPDARRIRMVETRPFTFDLRLLR